jgi:hypothetical protein
MPDNEMRLFASNTLIEHVIRGVIGIGAISVAISLGEPGGAWWSIPGALALGVLAIVAFRGCPICWTVGLFETLAFSWKGARASRNGRVLFLKSEQVQPLYDVLEPNHVQRNSSNSRDAGNPTGD